MTAVRFQNGPEAPEILLDEEVSDKATAADKKDRLAEIVAHYGTVEDAAAWLDGEDKPRGLETPPAEFPRGSRLAETPPTAPPAPEVLAKHQEEQEKLAAKQQQEIDDAKAEAEKAAEKEAKAAEAKSKK